MTEVSGEYWFGEARGANWLLSRKISGFGLAGFILYLALVMAAMFTATTLVDQFAPPWLAGWLSLPSIAVVGVAVFYAWYRWRSARLRKGWTGRGVANPSLTSFRIDDEVFVVASPAQEIRCRWSVISEIAPTRRHWVFIGAGLGYCVPRRFFADVEAERAFLAASLSHMSETARGRSRKAVAFVGDFG
jgi:hypothetical protein